MPDSRTLMVSLKPIYAELILAGEKTVELRRIRPQVEVGSPVLLYASSPRMEMVGTARVSAVDTGDLARIWRSYGHLTGIARASFDDYFAGCDRAIAITLTDVRKLRRVVPLAELRRRIAGFNPPQSFRYLAPAEASAAV